MHQRWRLRGLPGPSGVRTPRGRAGVREGGPGRRGRTRMRMPDRAGREGTSDDRMCRARRGEEAAGILLGCGDRRNIKPLRERQDRGRERQHRRSGERIPPRAFLRGVASLCLKGSYKASGVEVHYRRITKASVCVKAPETCCEQLYLKSEKCLGRGPQRQMLTKARRAMSVTDQACTALANRGAQ